MTRPQAALERTDQFPDAQRFSIYHVFRGHIEWKDYELLTRQEPNQHEWNLRVIATQTGPMICIGEEGIAESGVGVLPREFMKEFVGRGFSKNLLTILRDAYAHAGRKCYVLFTDEGDDSFECYPIVVWQRAGAVVG